MTRKIIQIAVTPGYKIETHLGGFKSPGGVVALCDDGTLWRLPDGNEKYSDSWFRLADIPQDRFFDTLDKIDAIVEEANRTETPALDKLLPKPAPYVDESDF